MKTLYGASQFGLTRNCQLAPLSDFMRLTRLTRSYDTSSMDSDISIQGIAIPYETASTDYGPAELFRRGAFAKSLAAKTDIPVFFNLDFGALLGRTRNLTARVFEDTCGLSFEVVPPKTSWADDLIQSLDRGDISGGAGQCLRTTSHIETRNGERIRVIDQADIMFLAVVAFPEFDSADVNVKRTPQSIAAARILERKWRPDGLKLKGFPQCAQLGGRVHF